MEFYSVSDYDVLGLFPEEKIFAADNCTVKTRCGKYADVDKDVLNCSAEEIHEAKNQAIYFEGKKVFSK